MAQARNETVIDSERILLKNDELHERERFKNESVQNFSHELRNPLTNILGTTELKIYDLVSRILVAVFRLKG